MAFRTISYFWYVSDIFFPPKERKMPLGCKNTGSIPRKELLITGKRARTLSPPRQMTKALRESPLRNVVLGHDSVMTRGRWSKPGLCPGQAC